MKRVPINIVAEDETGHDGLPEGWVMCSVEDISVLVTSGSRDWSQFYSTHGAFFIRSAEINDYTLRLSEAIRVALPKKVEGKRSLVEKGDILVTITGANVGKCAKVDSDISEAYVSQSVALIKLKRTELAPFVYYALRALNAAGSQLEEMAYGVGRPVLSLPQIKSLIIPLAPVAEQDRILLQVETLLARVAAASHHLAAIPRVLKAFRQSVLAAAFSGRLTEDWREIRPANESAGVILESIRTRREAEAESEAQRERLRTIYDNPEENDSDELPSSWRFVKLSKLCASFDYGTSTKSQSSGKVPVLRMGNIQRGEIDWTDLAYTSDRDEIMRYRLQPNTVLFNRTNSPELVGKTAIYRGGKPAIFAGYLIRIAHLPELDPQYLNLCLSTTYAREFCSHVKTDGVSQSNINAQKLGLFELPFCPSAEQHEIVRRVDALFKLADKIEERVKAATKRAENLTQAILSKAFRGELVSTEAELARKERRTYEPASELLNRINLNVAPERQELGRRAKRSGKRR